MPSQHMVWVFADFPGSCSMRIANVNYIQYLPQYVDVADVVIALIVVVGGGCALNSINPK